MTVKYDDLQWEIGEVPISSSTPDDKFELSYRATTQCPKCGNEIPGTANFWSREEDMSNAWLSDIDYEECEFCKDDSDEEENEEEEDFDEEI